MEWRGKEAFRRKYQDELCPAKRMTLDSLDKNKLAEYLHRLRLGKPNLSQLSDSQIQELMSITLGDDITLIQHYIKPLLDEGKMSMTIPVQPKSHKQKYVRT